MRSHLTGAVISLRFWQEYHKPLSEIQKGAFSVKKQRLYVNSWGKEKRIERKKQVVKNETERSEVEFSLPAFARWVIEICTEYENGSV